MSFEYASVHTLREAYAVWEQMTMLGLESQLTAPDARYANAMLALLVQFLQAMTDVRLTDGLYDAIRNTKEYLDTQPGKQQLRGGWQWWWPVEVAPTTRPARADHLDMSEC